ncbi:MAG: VOC family protein [Kutzneria sp.]|nr:VOC family protein [Kutzneria sp.]MBV9844668.1 VOC family protein [Kutzneria sp.]
MTGRLYNVVLDCPDPPALARFYCALLGAELVPGENDWVVIKDKTGMRIAFQRAPQHRPPSFPDSTASQQMHFDVLVDDVEAAEREVLGLGASRADGQGEDFRVFTDPAGHPFCLVWKT